MITFFIVEDWLSNAIYDSFKITRFNYDPKYTANKFRKNLEPCITKMLIP